VSASTASSAQAGPAAFDWLLLGSTVLLWGSTFAGLHVATQTIAPVWVIAGRLLIASLLLAIPAWLEYRSQRARERYARISWEAVIWMGMVGTVFTALPYLAYANAARTADSSVLAICNGAAPLFTALLAHISLRGEQLTGQRLAGVLLGFAGLVLLMLPELREGVTASGLSLLIAILAAALYAGGNIATRKSPRIPPITSSFILVSAGALASVPVALLVEPSPAAPSTESLLALIGIGVGPTGVAMIAYVLLVQRAGAVFVSFATYLAPLWALFLGIVFIGERPGWEAFVSLCLILLGVWIANLRPRAPVD
jgi:drug/metabolite transporter (DMT)-like permease